jgi:hypothetical protein
MIVLNIIRWLFLLVSCSMALVAGAQLSARELHLGLKVRPYLASRFLTHAPLDLVPHT